MFMFMLTVKEIDFIHTMLRFVLKITKSRTKQNEVVRYNKNILNEKVPFGLKFESKTK
jgi:hypothetical protein